MWANQEYDIDVTIELKHNYSKDKDSKISVSRPPTSGVSNFVFRRVECLRPLTFPETTQMLHEIQMIVDKYMENKDNV